MSHFGRVLVGWWEVMSGECSGHFVNGRGRRPVRRKQVAAFDRLRPMEEESRAGQAGPPGRLRPSGEGEAGRLGGREVAAAGLKTGAGPMFKK
jgi:hypothetical protein